MYGVGAGRTGDSYAIPTKDGRLRTLPLEVIAGHVRTFIAYDREHPEVTFQLTPIGCGLAGYQPAQIAPLFAEAPTNVILPAEFVGPGG